MISLHIAKLLEDNGYGTLALTGEETGNLIFFEKLPIAKTGVFIMSNGDSLSRGTRRSQSFDLFARGLNDIDGAKSLTDILRFFGQRYEVCELPVVPGYSEDKYTKIVIEPTFNITNVGLDATDRVIYSASATITYNEEQ